MVAVLDGPQAQDVTQRLRRGLVRWDLLPLKPPQGIRSECCRYRDELDATNLVLRMRFPGLPHDRVMNSIRLWAEKVIPYV